MAGTPADFSAGRAGVPGSDLFQGRLRTSHAEVTDVRRRRIRRQSRPGVHRHDARFHGTSPGYSRIHGVLQGGSRKAYDQEDGPAAEWATGLVFSRMGMGYAGAPVQFQV